MPELSPCFGKLSKEDQDYISDRVKELQDKGLSEKGANLRAAKELQDKTLDDLHNVYHQLGMGGFENRISSPKIETDENKGSRQEPKSGETGSKKEAETGPGKSQTLKEGDVKNKEGSGEQPAPSTSSKGIMKQANEIEDLHSPRDKVLQYFTGGGKIHSDVIKDLFGGSEGDKRSRIGLLGKDAPGIDKLAHDLWTDGQDREGENPYTTQDYKNAIEEVVQEHISSPSMARELVDNYVKKMEQRPTTEHPEEFDFTPGEIEQWKGMSDDEKEAALSIEDHTADIINREGITAENIDNLKNLFDGFPYTQEDFTAVKTFLANEGKGQSETENNRTESQISNQSHPEQAAAALRASAQRLAEDGDRDGAISLYQQADRIEAGKPPGEGPGSTNEGGEPSGSTGVKKAVIAAEREAAGKTQIENQLRRDFGDVLDNAKKIIKDNPSYVATLKANIDKFLRPLTAEETVALSLRKAEIANEKTALSKKIIQARKDANHDAEFDHNLDLERLEIEKDNIDRIASATNYEKGLSLAINKLLIQSDYSAEALVQRAKAKTIDGELSEAQTKKLEDLSAKLEEAQKKIDEHAEKISKLEAENKVKDLQKESGKKPIKEKKEKILAERKSLIDQFKKEWKGDPDAPKQQGIGLTDKMVSIVAKLARNYVEDGVVTLQEIVGNILNDLKEHAEGLDERTIRDAISGYDQPKKNTLSEVSAKIADLRKQAELASKIEDINAGRPIKTKERNAPRPTPEQTNKMREDLKNAMTKMGIDPYNDKALKQYKNRLNKLKTQYQDQITKGNYVQKEIKKRELVKDREAEKLQADVNSLKHQIDKEMAKIDEANKPKWQRRMEALARFRRAVLLSSVATVGKLGSAAMQRSIISPMEELAGAFIDRIPGIHAISKMAPREGGGFMFDAERRAALEWFNKSTYQEAYKKLNTGESEYDDADDKTKKDLVQRWTDVFGNVHSALKVPARANEFMRSVEKRIAFASKNGFDPYKDPVMMETIRAAAKMDAQRSVFMQDNLLSGAYQQMIEGLDARKNKSGDPSKGAKALATGLRLLLPIVKVPTNFAWESASYAAGAVKALPNIYKAIQSGVGSLKPEEADFVMRALKKQGIGIGMMTLGYFATGSVGGYYTGKRKEGDLKAGDVKLFGHELPHWMLHSPLMEMLQVGATLRRVHDASVEKGEDSPIFNAGWAAGKGLFGQVPFFNQAGTLGQAVQNPKQASQFGDDFVKSFIIPPTLDQIAKGTDTDESGKPIERKPEGLIEDVGSGIPGLREHTRTRSEYDAENKEKRHEQYERKKEKKEAAEAVD